MARKKASRMTPGSTRRYLIYLLKQAPFLPFRYFI